LRGVRKVTLDDVARLPRPGTTAPELIRFSPDGATVTYLYPPPGASGLARVLWSVDVGGGNARVLFAPSGEGTTEASVSAEEALRRERQRQMTVGVTSYEWAADANVLIAPVLGDVWLIGDPSRVVVSNATDPHLSPDGSHLAFVRDGDLWVADVASGDETRLTFDAEPGVANGLAEFIAQEELGRARGFWWDRDGSRIAFERYDERHIPPYVIPHWGDDEPSVEEHRYPFAGKDNARLQLGVVSREGGDTVWMDPDGAEYIARVDWHPDGRIVAQLLSRSQKQLTLRAFDPSSGRHETLLVEESPHWVDVHNDLRFLGSGEFIWNSAASGMRTLELRGADGSLVRALSHDVRVDTVLGFDEDARRVAFAGSVSPLEMHVFTASLDDGKPERLSAREGMTTAVFSKDLSTWVEVHHSRSAALSATLHEPARALTEPETVDLELVTPELFSFEDRDGVELFGAFFRPEQLPAPLIVAVYGGPHVQYVQDSWALTVDLQAQDLVSQGFAVMRVDNRGSARRDIAFETALAGRLGTVEIDDQVDGVRFAKAQGWVDGDRVGMTGWSYGGYMTIMCMLKAPDVFKVGVAGAPVTAMDGYDTCYNERYLGLPQDSPDAYRESSATTHASSLRGKLLIAHGMMDENVHFRHTARFVEALSKANLSCDLALYPKGRHGLRSEADRKSFHTRAIEYFRAHL
jgi:dipeptidyl-peptidase-4